MNQKNIVYLINFDKPLPDNIIESIKEDYPDIDELIIIEKKVTINFSRQIYIQCIDIRRQLEKEYDGIFSGNAEVVVNLPGLSIAAIYIINEIEAMLRRKPKILELIRLKGNDNLFNNFQFRRILDLDYNKNVSRNKIKNKENNKNFNFQEED